MKELTIGTIAATLGIIDHFHAWSAVGWSLLAIACVGAAAGMCA